MNSINSAIIDARLHDKTLEPVVSDSKNYVYWKSVVDFRRCKIYADLHDYVSGRRNNQRVLWSNDGLVFVTYNHYETFIEIV